MSTLFDLRGASDDEIAAFVFDHPVGDTMAAWWWDLDRPRARVDACEVAGFLARLFAEPEPVRERYTPAQIDQGFWLMFSAALASEFTAVLWNDAVPWDERRACIQALPTLYARLFEPILHEVDDFHASAMYMLPDFIAYDYDDGGPRSRVNEGDRRVQDALLEAFTRMLRSSCGETRVAALHGLGHLRHPDGPAAIRAFLASRTMSPDLRAYAERAMNHDVL